MFYLYLLELVFGPNDLVFLNTLSFEETFFYLKDLAKLCVYSRSGSAGSSWSAVSSWSAGYTKSELVLKINPIYIKPNIAIYKSSSKFVGFCHDLVGANFHCFSYHNDNVKSMVWQMKFNDNMKVVRIFGYCLNRLIFESQERSQYLSDFFLHEKCFLIPIPVHYRRLMERGYNQCSLLCREIMKNLEGSDFSFDNKIKYEPQILKRKVYKQKQSWIKNIDRSNRGTNIENVFAVSKKYRERISGAKIILIDDVFTTGATINEAVKVLLEAGASEVISFTIAR